MVQTFTQAVLKSVRPGIFLEVGTGSGRTTRPLLDALASQNSRLIGVDLSYAKLRQLAAHRQTSFLSQANATHLPFPAGSFDTIITVHVLHLIADWKVALCEFRRLLRPGGVYLRRGQESDQNSIQSRMRHLWQVLLQEKHLPQRHRERADEAIDNALRAMGAAGTAVEVSNQVGFTTPGREVERISSRVRDGAWVVPDEMLPGLLSDLKARAAAEFLSLDREFRFQKATVLHVWRF